MTLALISCAAPARSEVFGGESDEDAVIVTARRAAELVAAHAVAVAAGDPVAVLVEYARGVQCDVTTVPLTTALNGPCGAASGAVPAVFCGVGVTALDPLWTRTRTSATAAWTPWTYLTAGACPQDVLPALTTADFRRLPLPPTATTVQPGTGYVLVGYGIIVSADPTPVDLTTTLLGHPVTVHATPTTYRWDFGDDTSPLDTPDPGLPYPTDGSTPPTTPGSVYPVGSHGHPYQAPGTYTLTLTTTWTGTYQIAGDTTWRPITGTATTTTTHPALTVVERRTHLVADTCLTHPHGPGC
ncbi:hypothetical protein DDP54_11955 [Cellulomonas sp. WB94]|nr:hypothetical protein DDP54_11955 [Cellulomonas sp. WB94]